LSLYQTIGSPEIHILYRAKIRYNTKKNSAKYHASKTMEIIERINEAFIDSLGLLEILKKVLLFLLNFSIS
jgi:hypothetical protein|tara:strand:- start:2980 stop:3192 length:213 start_codon:yes stop_codon:yes gene_type:complete